MQLYQMFQVLTFPKVLSAAFTRLKFHLFDKWKLVSCWYRIITYDSCIQIFFRIYKRKSLILFRAGTFGTSRSILHLMHAIARAHVITCTNSLTRVKNSTRHFCLSHLLSDIGTKKMIERTKTSIKFNSWSFFSTLC